MTPRNFIAFMEKLIEKTKSGKVQWIRVERVPAWASSHKSFFCKTGTMEITIYASEDVDVITFVIRYDPSMPSASIAVESDEERRVALRLVNFIYDSLPNLETAIDRFLNDF